MAVAAYLARQACMVCSDGAPQVSKPARPPTDAGGGEDEGPGLTGWVGDPVPVGAGVGQDGGIQVGGIQEGGVGKLVGGGEAIGEGRGVADPRRAGAGAGPGVATVPDCC